MGSQSKFSWADGKERRNVPIDNKTVLTFIEMNLGCSGVVCVYGP